MSDFWDEQAVVGEVERDERNKIVVSQTKKKGKPLLLCPREGGDRKAMAPA